MKNFPERFAFVVTDEWQKITVNITNSSRSDKEEIEYLANSVIAQGYEIIMEGVEEFREEY
jgi:hypothetical protein